MENSKQLQIVEYLISPDEDLAAIGFMLLNSADLSSEYKLSILQKSEYKPPEIHKKINAYKMYPENGGKSYSYENGVFINRTFYSPKLSSYKFVIQDISDDK